MGQDAQGGSDRLVPTPHGMGRLREAPAPEPVATLVLSHGAGAGIDTADLLALAEHLPAQGFSVVRFEQPWKVAGRRVAGPPATLDAGLRGAMEHVNVVGPLILGGRSAGARSAARCARDLGAAGCLALSFPLHPPGRPGRSRLHELTGTGVTTLVVQGGRDPMGRPEEFPPEIDLAVVPDADHSFRVPKSAGLDAEDIAGIVVEAVLEWAVREVVGNQTRA